jgi:hypothetical protein
LFKKNVSCYSTLPPIMPPLTFRELYEDPAMDPYDGCYGDVMAVFTVTKEDWKASEVFDATLCMEPEKANAYVGFFEDANHPTGTTRLLHAPRQFPAKLGRPTHYDHEEYAILDDIQRGSVQMVEYPEGLFECTAEMFIPQTAQDAWEMWSKDDTLELLPPLKALDERKAVRVPKAMYIPPKYISLFMGKRLTPRQLLLEVYPLIVDDEQLPNLQPFIDWMMTCGMSAGKGKKVSPCLLPEVKPVLADARFIDWTKDFVDRVLPGQSTKQCTNTDSSQMATIMAEVLHGQQQLQADISATRTNTKAPKTVGEHFKMESTNKLMILCDVVIESDLPDVWVNLASNGGKRDRQIIEATFNEQAAELRMHGATPIVTPNLAKKIVDMRLVGTNMDDLDEGINPFSVVLIDNANRSAEVNYQTAIKAARNYDDLTKGVSVPLEELNAVQSTKAVIPTSFATAKAMLKGFYIIVASLLGHQHTMTQKYKDFLDDVEMNESFYADRIQKHDPNFGAARLLRFVQLHTRAWFIKTLQATDHAEAKAIKLPPFHKPAEKMAVNNMTWLPNMPTGPKHSSITPGQTGNQDAKRKYPDDASQSMHRPGTKRPNLTVVNPQRNKMFEDFSTKIANTKFKTAIEKIGPPPSVQRDGSDVAMCASYHLRGNCSTSCSRVKDHAPHSLEEDQQLYMWCSKAFS